MPCRPGLPLLLSTLVLCPLLAAPAHADAVTDWNDWALKASKGYNGQGGTGKTLNSNVTTRLLAIQGQAVFDAVNAIEGFSPRSYYYRGRHRGSAAAAAIQAAHDVLLAQLPDPEAPGSGADPAWRHTRSWLIRQRENDLRRAGLRADDPGLAAGRAAAAAANQARRGDGAAPTTSFGAELAPESNPGVGRWRQTNSGAQGVNPATGAPTGFDASGRGILGKPGIDANWPTVRPFSLGPEDGTRLLRAVPAPLRVGSPEYRAELAYVKGVGSDTSTLRTPDQTAQALFYKQDVEVFVLEAAQRASRARNLDLVQNARLFAALHNTLADSRILAFASKYQQLFWRPITALNADADGRVANAYRAWRPLAATPSHPSNTSGHSASGAAGFEMLRAFFGDQIVPDGSTVTLGNLPWMTGTNSGTGTVASRAVRTFSQAQLENGASRVSLGVHFGHDNLQGQLLGLGVSETILRSQKDPATAGLQVTTQFPASPSQIRLTLLAQPALYGLYGLADGGS